MSEGTDTTAARPLSPLDEIVREGARELLQRALELEVAEVLSQFADLRDDAGRHRIVRNGHLPERAVGDLGRSPRPRHAAAGRRCVAVLRADVPRAALAERRHQQARAGHRPPAIEDRPHADRLSAHHPVFASG